MQGWAEATGQQRGVSCLRDMSTEGFQPSHDSLILAAKLRVTCQTQGPEPWTENRKLGNWRAARQEASPAGGQ